MINSITLSELLKWITHLAITILEEKKSTSSRGAPNETNCYNYKDAPKLRIKLCHPLVTKIDPTEAYIESNS